MAQLVLELSPCRQFDNATKRDPVFCAEHTALDRAEQKLTGQGRRIEQSDFSALKLWRKLPQLTW